jgi:hypothetical protein
MHSQPRHAVRTLDRGLIPKGKAGVYAFYRDGGAVYVGKATDLDDRLWCHHLSQKPRMGDSALRRNVAELLGIATPNEIKEERYVPSAEEVQRVNEWIRGTDVAWVARDNVAAAVALETAMKAEWMPPLTKR